MHKTHIGPLPDAETLSEYSAIIPNGAERIMKMAEKQLDHRMKMENKVVGGQMLQSNIGQFLAFFIGIAALAASTYCIVSGYELSGSIIGIGGLTGLVTAFIKGRSRQEKSLEEKNPRPKRQSILFKCLKMIFLKRIYFFLIIDVVEVFKDSNNSGKYQSDLKIKLKNEGSQLSDFIVQLKMVASDGKMKRTDVANTEELLKFFQLYLF